jgi:FixJ family two-component response regulator
MPDADATVLVIDDDPNVQDSLARLLRSLGVGVQLFASIADFLASNPPDDPTSLVLDVRPPGQSGLDLQSDLTAAKRQLPIIFISGQEETGPFGDRARRDNDKDLRALKERFDALPPRKREIMTEVARGRLSKQIAGGFGIAEATVKAHGSRLMEKINARSLPELGRMADKLRIRGRADRTVPVGHAPRLKSSNCAAHDWPSGRAASARVGGAPVQLYNKRTSHHQRAIDGTPEMALATAPERPRRVGFHGGRTAATSPS